MEEKEQHLQDLKEIRSLMEKSSRYLSLSGLSGVFAGVYALVGAYFAWAEMNACKEYYESKLYISNIDYGEVCGRNSENLDRNLITIALFVLGAALITGFIFSWVKAKKENASIWDSSARRLLLNLFIPLVTGGFFCMILMHYNIFGLVAPATLIFYGLGLVNASKYTFNDVRYLGVAEIILGLVASFYIGYGIIFWAIGFGVLHIVYGAVMYFRYEMKKVITEKHE